MSAHAEVTRDRWSLAKPFGIVWDAASDARLPHSDHVEMSGRRVSLWVHYGVGADRSLTWERQVIWPTLRIEPDRVRSYLTRTFDTELTPVLLLDDQPVTPGPVRRVTFDGALTVEHELAHGLAITRCIFPSPRRPEVIERWTVRNETTRAGTLTVQPLHNTRVDHGIYGEYRIDVAIEPRGTSVLEPGEERVACAVRVAAWRADQPVEETAADDEVQARRRFVASVTSPLVLDTPDPVLNRALAMAKLRAAESVFETKAGLMHSPGGRRYYAGMWANDQGEYAAPLFPFLGEAGAIEASLNCFRMFARKMTPAYDYLPTSFEMEADIEYHAGGDRGDAAMIAIGASRFVMALGDRALAEELWPAIQWCLEFCRRRTNASGVVESDSDELEGRFPTGTANLSTSTIAYGALRSATHLGRDIGAESAAAEYDRRADALRDAIERYFGSKVEGFDTYRYYDGNTVLRAWICLPLVVGIDERRAGTLDALFSPRLWTDDGLATEAGKADFWDRATLYALRGAFAASDVERGLARLRAYTRRRLLGDHVPYPVEAAPEGDQAHLAAESALYCRIITEGLFGIEPVGLRAFRCTPRLPREWDRMALRGIAAFGGGLDVELARDGAGARLIVSQHGRRVVDEPVPPRGGVTVDLPSERVGQVASRAA